MIRRMLPGEYLDVDEALLGRTITRLVREPDQIEFALASGGRIVMYDASTGSECDLIGNPADLLDREVTLTDMVPRTPDFPDEGVSIRLGTEKGTVTFQWRSALTVDCVAPRDPAEAGGKG